MKANDIQKAGIPTGPLLKLALSLMGPAAQAGLKKKQIMERLRSVVAAPDAFLDDSLFGALAKAIVEESERGARRLDVRSSDLGPRSATYSGQPTIEAPWRMWGSDIDRAAIDQMRNACRLPVAVQGALMPDAHSGYGLPIGGVLAVDRPHPKRFSDGV